MDGLIQAIIDFIQFIAGLFGFGIDDPHVKVVACGVGLIIGALISTLLIWAYVRKARHSHYSELDRIYFDLLKMRVEHPEVVGPPRVRHGALGETQEDIVEKQTHYSYMIWTLLETIYDRAQESKMLQLTWQPIIRTEGEEHIAYIANKENRGAFQIGFLRFIRGGGFRDYCDAREELERNVQFEDLAARHLSDIPPPRRTFADWLWRRRWWIAITLAALGAVAVSAVYGMARAA